jgi:lysophospholipase L1-like esterase
VGGNTSAQLLERLKGELEEIKPTVFSLLIGVNDTWRRFDSNQIITEKEFSANLTAIIETVKTFNCKIIILEPFLLNTDPEKRKFREDLNPKIQIVRDTAQLYKTDFIPLDGIFSELCCRNTPDFYSYDGVHPTAQGHTIIAQEWLKRMTIKEN